MYNRDSKIIRKLLGGRGADASTGDLSALAVNASSSASSATPGTAHAAGGAASGGASTAASTTTYRPSRSRDGVYSAGVPISCLDISPDRRAVVLGGPFILKTVVLDDPNTLDFRFSEGVDVRAAIHGQPQPASGSKLSAVTDQLNIRDVKWKGSSTIFTACANGRIFSYDVARIGAGARGDAEPLDYIQMHEDSRQVNSLDVNPHFERWLLTGSQDGVARVFDTLTPVHTRSGVLSFHQRYGPLRCIDPVRQVKWCSNDGQSLACCTDSGVIMKWDLRQPSRPMLRINAHEKACTSIAWHPDGSHLISAGSDAKLHVWDLRNDADRRQKPKWSISTPAPVATVSWRPGLWSATAQSRRAAQVAVSYDDGTPRRYGTSAVHLWDLARPTMPYKEIERFESSPSAVTWLDQDLLWTVGQDSQFNQCDVARAPRTIDRQPTSSMAFSPRGDVVMFLDERPQQTRHRSAANHSSQMMRRSLHGSSPNTPKMSESRSDSEEEVLGTFLSPRKRRHHKRRNSARATTSLSTTPPSAVTGDAKKTMPLELAIKITGTFKSQQTMASGHIPAAKSVHVYQYLSTVYLETLENELPLVEGGKPLVERVISIMNQYAAAAEHASLFRLAQTWRILAFAVRLLLKRRAAYHLEARLSRSNKTKFDEKNQGKSRATGEATPRQPNSQAATFDSRYLGRSLLSEEFDSTSNVPTPLARPVDDATYQNHGYQYGKKLTPIVEPESFSIGPAVHGHFNGGSNGGSPRRRLDSMPISFTSQESEHSQLSSTEGYDFYDTDQMMQAIDVPSPMNRSNWKASGPRAKTLRHDSNESYGQVFSISEGTKPSDSPSANSFSRARQASTEGSDSNSVEYGSRIRGEQMPSASPDKKKLTKQQPPQQQPPPYSDSPEEVFLISQTTQMSDEPYPTQTSFASGTTDSVDSHTNEEHAMASSQQRTPRPAQHGFGRPPSPPSPPCYYDPTPTIIEADYLPWPDDPPYPHPLISDEKDGNNNNININAPHVPPPLDPYTLITRALDFESRTSALNSSAIVLLLKPLVPDTVIDRHRASAILRQHHTRLMHMSLFVEAALLRNLCVPGWPAGVPEWEGSDGSGGYPAIFGSAQRDVKVFFTCPTCHRPRERDPNDSDASIWKCERCRSVMAPCAVCGHREPELAAHVPSTVDDGMNAVVEGKGTSVSSEWWYCPGCAHGGHASCLQMWHAFAAENDNDGNSASRSASPPTKFSGGCCPLDGCGHACLPGRYRGETATQRAEELGRAAVEKSRARDGHASGRSSPRGVPERASGGSVRNDTNDVPQSRAVGVAREALNKSGGSTGGGILSSSPGRAMERERRKSVKFAKTDP